MLQPKISKKFY